MSKFTGKCDCFDWFIDRTDEYIQASTFYCNNKEIKINNRFELIPYYPYLIASGGADKEHCTVYLTDKSYIDEEEKRSLNINLNILKEYFKECQKKNEKFKKTEAYKLVEPYGWNRRKSHELVNRVAEYGTDAKIDGIHDSTHERLRDEFCDFMIKNGYKKEYAFKWVFGEERYLDKIREKEEKKNSVKK